MQYYTYDVICTYHAVNNCKNAVPNPPHPHQQVTTADIIQQGAFVETTAAFHSY